MIGFREIQKQGSTYLLEGRHMVSTSTQAADPVALKNVGLFPVIATLMTIVSQVASLQIGEVSSKVIITDPKLKRQSR